ncbi:MAG: methyltransferase domain-containing protein, partial [Fibrobacterota bacterium]
MSLPFCTLPRKHFWDDEKWQKTAMELGLSTEYTRRNFEWTHTAYILSEAGLLHSEASGLGLGVGREPLPFYLSRFCAEIVGADNFEERWKKSEEADPGIIRTPSSYTKIPFNRDVLKFIRMDAREFKFSSHSFNFVWSCSSIEHMSNAWSGFHRAV